MPTLKRGRADAGGETVILGGGVDGRDIGRAQTVFRSDPDGVAEQLVERYGAVVYRVALRITGAREDAEKAAVDALGRAAGRTSTFTNESERASWIYRAAAKAAYEKLRDRRRHVTEITLTDLIPSLDGDGKHFVPTEDWSKRVDDEQPLPGGLSNMLAEAIDALPPEDRTTLVLHDVEGASAFDIAEILGVDVSAVARRLHWARLFVRKHLSKHFEVAPSGLSPDAGGDDVFVT